MKIAERLGLESPLYFFPRPVDTKYDEDLTRWTNSIPLSINAWMRESIERKRSVRGIFSAVTNRKESLFDHMLEGIEFVGRMDIADRASNGLRQAVKWDNQDHTQPSPFGLTLEAALEDPEFSDHSHPHFRRDERWVESFFVNIPDVRHAESVIHWIDSAMLTPYWHDADQLLNLKRNKDEGLELNVKAAHDLGSAAMLMVLHKRYAHERKVSYYKAWEITAGAVRMILKHDEPERYIQSFGGMRKPYIIEEDGTHRLLSGTELEDAYNNNELDLYAIAPSQILELLRRKRLSAGFIKQSDKSWGLHPAFEKEYTRELAQLAADHEPILRSITPSGRRSLRLASEATLMADVMDMISPPVESIFKKIATQRSRNRPYFRPELRDSLLDQILSESGDIDPTIDSDVRRQLWELAHIEHVSEGAIANSRFIKNLNRDNAIMGALLFKEISSRIMAGDLSDFDRVYASRKHDLVSKGLKRVGAGIIERARASMRQHDIEGIAALFAARGRSDVGDRLVDRLDFLDRERDFIKGALIAKADVTANGIHVYAKEEILQFRSIADKVIDHLCKKYKVTPANLRRYKSKVARGKGPFVPYNTYDSLGGDPKTLVAPLQTRSE